MSVAAEVKQDIMNRWREPRVARWVIDQLPLLHQDGERPSVPVYALSLRTGLRQLNNASSRFSDFRNTQKLVISGGLEGTAGQTRAIKEIDEIRTLTSGHEKTAIAVMIEPDRFIIDQKCRRPIVNQRQRSLLWSTSGLIDAVINLPRRQRGVIPTNHYSRIHDHIAPAEWVTNVENPARFEIIMRKDRKALDIIRLIKHQPMPHTSFLEATRTLSVQETRAALFDHLLGMVKKPDLYTISEFIPPKESAAILYQEMSRGL